MPSSAKDRFTVDFEPVYFFTKSGKYWFEQQKEPHKRDFSNEGGGWQNGKYKPKKNTAWKNDPSMARGAEQVFNYDPHGRNKRCVWDIPTKPCPEAHFAVFPETLVEPMIKAGCPERGIVLDPFSGIGTTCRTAKKFNRQWIGFDLNKEYIDMGMPKIEDTQYQYDIFT